MYYTVSMYMSSDGHIALEAPSETKPKPATRALLSTRVHCYRHRPAALTLVRLCSVLQRVPLRPHGQMEQRPAHSKRPLTICSQRRSDVDHYEYM